MNVVHDVKNNMSKCAYPVSPPSIHFGAWKRCQPAVGWLTRQHCGDSLKEKEKEKGVGGPRFFFLFS